MRFVLHALVVTALLRAPRLLAVEPSAFDQYMLELINRARLDPEGEAARHGIDLNEGPPYREISSEPRQPLTFHLKANDAALANAAFSALLGTQLTLRPILSWTR